MFVFNWGDYMANTTLIEAMSSRRGGVSENLSLFKKAIAYNSFANPEIREQLPAVTIEVFSNKSISEDLKKYFFDFTREELLKQIDLTPNDARKEYFLGSFLNRFGMYQEAVNHLSRALELSPNKQSMMFELASSYVGLNQPDKVFEILKRAYDLAPSYTEAQINYAVGAAFIKNHQLAKEIVETLPKNIYWTDNRILTVFASAKEYTKVIEIWKYRIEMNPDDFQAHFSLASIYVEMGDKSSAIAEIRKISEKNPQYKDQIEGYVKDIQAGKDLTQ
jgi:tetratricopeptide (TPR) repeat protein